MLWKVLPTLVVSLLALNSGAFACWEGGSAHSMGYAPGPRIFFQAGLSELGAASICGPPEDGASYPTDDMARHFKYDSMEKAKEETLADWFTIIEGLPRNQESQKALLDLIGESSPADLENLQAAFSGTDLKGPFSDNVAAKAIVQSRNQAALDYLIFSHDLSNSGLLGYPDGHWGYGKKRNEQPRAGLLAAWAQRGEASYELPSLPPQLRMYYAFQLIRIYFYADRHDRVIEFFENDLADKSQTAALEWCRSYYGGSLHATGRDVEAFAAFAAVFHRSARYGHNALSSLHITNNPLSIERPRPASPGDWGSTYSEAEQKWLQTAGAEEAALYRSARNYVGGHLYEALAAVLSLIEHGGRIPDNLEEYLVSAVGRIERKTHEGFDAYQPNQYSGGHRPDPSMVPDPDLERMVLKIGATRPHPALWQLAAAHLAIMRRDEKAAESYINLAANNGAVQLMPIQFQITTILKDALFKPLNAANGQRLAEGFVKLDLLMAKASVDQPGLAAWFALWESVLARRYQEAGDDATAFLCLEVANTRQFKTLTPFSDDSLEFAEDRTEGPDDAELPYELFTVQNSYNLRWADWYAEAVLSDAAALKKIRRIILEPQGSLEKYFQENIVGWMPRVIDELTGLASLSQHDYLQAIKVLRGITNQAWAKRRYKEKMSVARSSEGLKAKLRDTYRLWRYSDSDWRLRASMTNINPFRASSNYLFGPKWTDDFNGLFEAAARAGLSEHSRKTIEQLTDPPETFLEMAQKMKRLKELSKQRGELGATSAYFYVLAIYNNYGGYRDETSNEINRMLALALKKTKNRELGARANFIMADITERKANFYYYEKIKASMPPEAAKPYYRALSDLKDTGFVQDISFNCPAAAAFIK